MCLTCNLIKGNQGCVWPAIWYKKNTNLSQMNKKCINAAA